MIPSLFSEASISAIDFTGISSPPCTNKWRSSLVFSTISTPTIPPLYVYNLVFGRSWETNGVGKQHWWDWGRFENIRAEALTWLVSLNNNLTGSVGKRILQKDESKREYPNLFKGRQSYRLKIHLKTLRQSLSKNQLAAPSSWIVPRLVFPVYF